MRTPLSINGMRQSILWGVFKPMRSCCCTFWFGSNRYPWITTNRPIAADVTARVTVMWPLPCWCTMRGCVYGQMHWAWMSSALTKNLPACIPSNYSTCVCLINPSVAPHSFFVRSTAGTTETAKPKVPLTCSCQYKMAIVGYCCSTPIWWPEVWPYMEIYSSLQKNHVIVTGLYIQIQ